MQWQRLLRSAAAVVGAAALGCESAPSLRAADPPVAARLQKADADGKPVTPAGLVTSLDPLPGGRVVASVCATVNGVPIFDDEVNEAALGPLSALRPGSEDEYKNEVKKIKAAALEQLIERELLVQEAESKLKKAGKKDV